MIFVKNWSILQFFLFLVKGGAGEKFSDFAGNFENSMNTRDGSGELAEPRLSIEQRLLSQCPGYLLNIELQQELATTISSF
jgi:hypothetical protein